MKFGKKAAIEMEKIIIAIIVLVVLAVIILIFTGQIGKTNRSTSSQIDCMQADTDKDGVNDLLDKCCNTPNQEVGFDGCPSGTEDSQKQACDLKNCKPNE